LFVTENEGASWEQISPDLTTNDKAKQAASGGPITKDNTSVEYYCTIFTAAESILEKDLLWTGSDDGLIHVSRDAGKNWENVTPKDCPKWMMWNAIETSPFSKGTAYVTGTRYKLDDFTPYIYKTTDYGKTWKLITNGINKMHFTRVMRADPKKQGLLYAGTEYGMYISYNDGANWKPFQLNLPVVPITDLTIKNNDLVVATQGRAFWVIDDLTMVQQMSPEILLSNLKVYDVNPAYRMMGNRFSFSSFGIPKNVGTNPPKGAVINYYAKNVTDTTITILDKNRKVIRTYATDSKEDKLEISKGMNSFNWNLQYPEAEKIDGMILWNGVPGNIIAPPGNYFAKIMVGKDSAEVPFTVLADPNYKITQEDYEAQFAFLQQVQGKFNESQKGIKDVRNLRLQINDFTARQGKDMPKDVKLLCDTINRQLNDIEESLYQNKSKSSQDVLNYPIRLNDKLSGLFDAANSGHMAPSKQSKEVYTDLAAQVDTELGKLSRLKNNEVQQLNQLIREKSLPVIGVKKD
jgi:hypothetical protein